MPTQEKVEKVRGLAEQLTHAQAAILADYRGLTVPEIRELRLALRDAETRFAVVKNRLTKLAVREAGMAELEEFLTGPTAIAFVMGDPVAGAKALVDATKRFPVIDVKGGFVEGRVLGADDVRTLAALQSREAMLAKVAGLLKLELVKTASVLQALLRRFGAVLVAYREKLEETTGPEPEAVPEPESVPEEEGPPEEEAAPEKVVAGEEMVPDTPVAEEPISEESAPEEESTAEEESAPEKQQTESDTSPDQEEEGES